MEVTKPVVLVRLKWTLIGQHAEAVDDAGLAEAAGHEDDGALATISADDHGRGVGQSRRLLVRVGPREGPGDVGLLGPGLDAVGALPAHGRVGHAVGADGPVAVAAQVTRSHPDRGDGRT